MIPFLPHKVLIFALGAAFVLGLGVVTASAEEPLVAEFFPAEELGVLRLGPKGKELASREGWIPEEIMKLRGGLGSLSLVIWRSFPRRLYARPELWRQLGEVVRKVWPPEGQDLSWYQAEISLRAFKGRDHVQVRHALVLDNFEAPALQVHETFGFRAGSFRPLGRAYDPPSTPAQTMNLMAAKLQDGDHEGAQALASSLPREAREERERAVLMLGIPAQETQRSRARQELLEIANRRGASALQAADLLLQMKTKEATRGQ